MTIPNYERYKQVIDWWINKGYQGIKEDNILKVLTRLIQKYGKVYKRLYSVVPNDIFLNNCQVSLKILPCSKMKIDVSNDNKLITIHNAVGISPNIFGYDKGYVFDKEILICGKYTIKDSNLYMESKVGNNFSDLIDILEKINNTININSVQDKLINQVNELSINIDNLKKTLLNNGKQ